MIADEEVTVCTRRPWLWLMALTVNGIVVSLVAAHITVLKLAYDVEQLEQALKNTPKGVGNNKSWDTLVANFPLLLAFAQSSIYFKNLGGLEFLEHLSDYLNTFDHQARDAISVGTIYALI